MGDSNDINYNTAELFEISEECKINVPVKIICWFISW